MTAAIDHVVGDVTDPVAVARAVDGCDAVLHAAAVYKLDTRAHAETARTNVAGAEVVLRAAVERGCDPLVHRVLTRAQPWRRPWNDCPAADCGAASEGETRHGSSSVRRARVSPKT